MIRLGALVLALVCLASPLAAQALQPSAEADDAAQRPETAQEIQAVATAIAHQDWYPAAYLELLAAATLQSREDQLPTNRLLKREAGSDAKVYSLFQCVTSGGGNGEVRDPDVRRLAGVALNVARIRNDLARLGFPQDVIIAPLLRYEHAMFDQQWANANSGDIDHAKRLADDIEALRSELAPNLPRVVVRGFCPMLGAGQPLALMRLDPPVVRTAPAGGEVWLISSFGFKVCVLRQRDPWDPYKCGWREIETGKSMRLEGNYVYRVLWPDGVERKGKRAMKADDYDDDGRAAVVLRKTGS